MVPMSHHILISLKNYASDLNSAFRQPCLNLAYLLLSLPFLPLILSRLIFSVPAFDLFFFSGLNHFYAQLHPFPILSELCPEHLSAHFFPFLNSILLDSDSHL